MDKEDCEIIFSKINTGNGFTNDLIATANNRIELATIEICKLKKTIILLDNKNEKLQKRIFWLTIVGLVLAASQIIQVLDTIVNWIK